MRKTLIAIGLVTLILAAIWIKPIVEAQRSAPLIYLQTMVSEESGELVLGLELANRSKFQVSLSSLIVTGPQATKVTSIVSLPTERSTISAANIALEPDRGPHHEGTVGGLQVGHLYHGSYGLRMTWPRGTRLPEAVTVQYRYLWYPMELRIPLCGDTKGRPVTILPSWCSR